MLDYSLRSVHGGGSAAALSVGDLTTHLASLIRQDFLLQDIWVRGEVSQCTRAGSGHVYFTLKDASASLGCVMWRSTVARIPFNLEPGMEILAHGALDVYHPRGQYQLIADELLPAGEGALYLALEQLRQRLLAEGLFDEDRKRLLPAFPCTVVVITSSSGAAIRDICVTLQAARFPPRVLLIPALVQGAGAEESLCAALEQAKQLEEADLLIIGRGGGSVEDLWCFNAEAVVRGIANCPIPVISAVGHETDFTLADLVADLRAATPTAAAEWVVDRRDEMVRRLEISTTEVRRLFTSQLEIARLRLEGLHRRAPLARPEWMLDPHRQRLDELNARLLHARNLLLTRWRHRLALAAGKLDSLSPLSTLARGYGAVTRLPGLERITGVGELQPGDRVQVRMADGSFESTVERINGRMGQDE